MSPDQIIQLIGVGTVSIATLVAVVGVTMRFALMPLVKARRQAALPAPDTARLDLRMDALEEEVRHLGSAVERVATAVEFDAQLRAPNDPARLPGANS